MPSDPGKKMGQPGAADPSWEGGKCWMKNRNALSPLTRGQDAWVRFIDNGRPSVPTDPCWFNPTGSRPGQREERPSQGREKGSWMFGCVNRLATLPFKHKLPWACLSTTTAPGFTFRLQEVVETGCPSCLGRGVVESMKPTALPVLPHALLGNSFLSSC